MIEIINLTKKFKDTVAVNNLNLLVKKGEIFGFLGPNGAGKTTTIKMLSGLLKPTEGRALICGYDIQKDGLLAKKIIGLVPDNPFVYPKLTGLEFLKFIGDIYKVDKTIQNKLIPELLYMFELANFKDDLIETYSRGMHQKLVFASVLLHNPKVILLDEPLVGLDPKSARLVKEIILNLSKKGVSVFMSTHILEIAEKLCHMIGIIYEGKLLTVGTKEELEEKAKVSGNLEEIFLSLTGDAEYSQIIKVLQ